MLKRCYDGWGNAKALWVVSGEVLTEMELTEADRVLLRCCPVERVVSYGSHYIVGVELLSTHGDAGQ